MAESIRLRRAEPPLTGQPVASATPAHRQQHWDRRLAAVLGVLGLGSAVALSSLLLPWVPDLPSHLPPPVQRWLGAVVPEPDWDAASTGPWVQNVQQRGVLVAAVRYYPRPAPPNAPTPPEPDGFDESLARFLAQRLGVRLELVPAPHQTVLRGLPPRPAAPPADLVIAGSAADEVPPSDGARPLASTYTAGPGRLAVLRGSAIAQAKDLRQASVCVQQGSPYAHTVAQQWGAVPRTYPSGIHAVSGFMAGECQALAEDEAVVTRLMAREEWRFYRVLGDAVAPDTGHAQVLLAQGDADSVQLLDRLVRHWKINGALLDARERRVGDIAFEVTQLGDGLICHS